ncbi:MAG TPA: hypothetical protein VH092_15285 [Urbifossiella sp.]|jgi:hypothetical protein|nr:hypothetical protein [Urbifossiella sp.]
MAAYDLILATALLAAPPGTPEGSPTPDRWPAIQEALHKTAIQLEILDERETRYVLARAEDYETDLDLLRRRYQELRDAPRLSDADRFPARDAVNQMIQFNRTYRHFLEGRQTWEADRADVIGVALAETDRLYKVWDAVRDARCEFYYVTVRRQALKRLRESVGETAYGAVELPPHVPAWRFLESR